MCVGMDVDEDYYTVDQFVSLRSLKNAHVNIHIKCFSEGKPSHCDTGTITGTN